MRLGKRQENIIPNFFNAKFGMIKIIKVTLLIIALVFSSFPKEAFAGRSGAGGGKVAKFDSDDLFRSVAISVGCAVVGQALGSAWSSASALSHSSSAGYLTNTYNTTKTIVTSLQPWSAAGHSLISLTSLTPTLINGYSTYVASSQMANAIGTIGSCNGWDTSNTYLVSSIITSLATGAINPQTALASSLGGNSLVNMGKGALASAASGTVKGLTVLSIDREKIRQGKNPGITSSILGMLAGETTLGLSKAAMDPSTYHQVAGIFKREDAKPSSYKEYQASGGTAGPLKGRGPLSQEGYESAAEQNQGVAYKYDYKTIENVDVKGNIKYGQAIPGDAWESKYYGNRYDADYVTPDVIKITDTQAPFSWKDTAYKLLWKVPIVDTFSRQNFADWAGRSIGIIVEGNLDEDKKWMAYLRPLAKSLSQSISSDILSNGLNIWPINADQRLGSKNDLIESRLQQPYAVKMMGIEVGMRPFNKNAFDKTKTFDDQVKQLAKDYQSEQDMGKFKEKLTNLIESFKEDINEKSISPDRKFDLLFDVEKTVGALNDEDIRGLLKGENLPAQYNLSAETTKSLSKGKIRDLETKMSDISQDTSLSLGEKIRNEAAIWERTRFETAMTVGSLNEKLPLLGALREKTLSDELSISKAISDFNLTPKLKNELSAPEALKQIGVNRWSLAGKLIAFKIPSNIFEGALTSGVEGYFQKNFNTKDTVSRQILKAYTANIAAAAVRGAAWHYGWGHLSKDWPWHKQWDFVMPERYDRNPGDPDFDFMQYKISESTFDEETDRFNRFVALNEFKPEYGLNYHGERVRFDLTSGEEIKDPRWVASIVFKEEEPPLGYAIGRSIEQANMDYFANTFSFGAPLVRFDSKSLAIGIDPKQVSSAAYVNYLDSVQNQAQKDIPGVILYNAVASPGSAIKSAISKSLGGTLLQIPYLPEAFNMQPERLVFAGTLREEKHPRRDISTKTMVMATEYYQNSNGVETVLESDFGGPQNEEGIEMPLPEDKLRDYAGLGDYEKISLEEIRTDSYFRWGQEITAEIGKIPAISGAEELGIEQAIKKFDQDGKLKKEEFEFADRGRSLQFPPNFQQIPNLQAIPIAAGKEKFGDKGEYLFEHFLNDTPAFNAPSERIGYWKYLVDKNTSSVTTIQDGMQAVYFYTNLKAMPSTIQSLSGGGGGLPNLGTTFYAPFPNPLYRLKPQTAPIEYMRGTRHFSAPQGPQIPLNAPVSPDGSFFYNVGSHPAYNLYNNNLPGLKGVDQDIKTNNVNTPKIKM